VGDSSVKKFAFTQNQQTEKKSFKHCFVLVEEIRSTKHKLTVPKNKYISSLQEKMVNFKKIRKGNYNLNCLFSVLYGQGINKKTDSTRIKHVS
jgi:hypothetical protein